MIKEAFQYLISLSPAQLIKVDGDLQYSDKPLTPIKNPTIDSLKVSTLDGFIDLISESFEGFKKPDVLVVVSDHESVELIAKGSDKWGRRLTYFEAALPKVTSFPFGTFQDHESFIIGLQSQFTVTGDRDYLLKIASNITNEQVRTSSENGISQEVGVKAGVVLKTTETLKSRVSLAPFRTFREVAQPASEFIFRVRQQGQAAPQLALFEADGGKWKIDAMESIGKYLRINPAVDGIHVVV